jgi:hypothetical protein
MTIAHRCLMTCTTFHNKLSVLAIKTYWCLAHFTVDHWYTTKSRWHVWWRQFIKADMASNSYSRSLAKITNADYFLVSSIYLFQQTSHSDK